MTSIVEQITRTDIFKRDGNKWATGAFVGRPFSLNYGAALLLVADSWKQNAGGIPQGCFLLAYYQNEIENLDAAEAILLRVIQPTQLPTDSEIIGSMIEYYKDDMRTGQTRDSQLDTFTRYEFSFSGLECSVLGSFYRDPSGGVRFGADLENFFSAHNYAVIKPNQETLTAIVNYREEGTAGGPSDIKIGRVRYSSSRRFQSRETQAVPVYVVAPDFAGKRTALFGMTRTGKSNTLKKIIQACVQMSGHATRRMNSGETESPEEVLNPFTSDNDPKYPIGQIIFDINGEYANPNLQDQGTAIFDLYRNETIRYSTIRKEGFREMKVNFYSEIETGFDLIRSYPQIAADETRFVKNFVTVDLTRPDEADRSALTRYERKIAVYKTILYRARFTAPDNLRVSFSANDQVRQALNAQGIGFQPRNLTLEQAANWWESLWEIYGDDPTGCFANYRRDNDGREWADDDLKALLAILTRKTKPSRNVDCNGFRVLRPLLDHHTDTLQTAFEIDILSHLREGKIVIVDLSLGDPNIQRIFSERVCKHIFNDAMARFTQATPNNFIQFYFEEAHNLFPKKEDKDLSQIYNRLAKEGAKLHLGLVYATQEVSSVSANILKATQNWFISHLNNEEEIRELRKYYDFKDFAEGLIRFSQSTDKGFIRMKTYSNPFVIPIQVDRFPTDPIAGS
jgi:hypothetical protein